MASWHAYRACRFSLWRMRQAVGEKHLRSFSFSRNGAGRSVQAPTNKAERLRLALCVLAEGHALHFAKDLERYGCGHVFLQMNYIFRTAAAERFCASGHCIFPGDSAHGIARTTTQQAQGTEKVVKALTLYVSALAVVPARRNRFRQRAPVDVGAQYRSLCVHEANMHVEAGRARTLRPSVEPPRR